MIYYYLKIVAPRCVYQIVVIIIHTNIKKHSGDKSYKQQRLKQMAHTLGGMSNSRLMSTILIIKNSLKWDIFRDD